MSAVHPMAAKVRRDRLRELLNKGCACHLNPPCNLCSELDEGEWEIFVNDGTDALLNQFKRLDEMPEGFDRPMSTAAERNLVVIAAAEQRGAERERAAIAVTLRLRAKTLRSRKALGMAEEVDALAFYVEQRGDR
jgi:hypothetical protein